MIEFADWMRDRLEELDANRSPDDDTDYLSLLPRLLEWQRWLLIHALELLEGLDVFRFRTVLLLVARQNGKSTLLTVLILWRMFQDGAKMVLETHASLDHAKKAWEEAVAVAEAIPELADEIAKVNQGKGSELLRLDGNEKFKIASANRRGGRGFSGDLIIFDELREHQSWSAWSATSKTTMARARAQVWGVSNAGDPSSVVLWHLRRIALAFIAGKPLDDMPPEFDLDAASSIGLFEWSSGTVDGTLDGPLRGVWDREGWAEANPSLGWTELTERAIAAAAASDPEVEFRTEVLCQFVNSVGSGPFPTGSWKATEVPRVERDTSRLPAFGVDMSHNRTWVHVAIAFWDTDGRVRVELAASRAGPDWLVPWLRSKERKVPIHEIALQSRGAPISSLADDIEKGGIEVVPWEGPALAGWHGLFFDRLRSAVLDDRDPDEPLQLTHGVQPLLDVAATSAPIKAISGGVWVVDRKADPDPSPLLAAIAAVGRLLTRPERHTSVYEDHDLMVV